MLKFQKDRGWTVLKVCSTESNHLIFHVTSLLSSSFPAFWLAHRFSVLRHVAQSWYRCVQAGLPHTKWNTLILQINTQFKLGWKLKWIIVCSLSPLFDFLARNLPERMLCFILASLWAPINIRSGFVLSVTWVGLWMSHLQNTWWEIERPAELSPILYLFLSRALILLFSLLLILFVPYKNQSVHNAKGSDPTSLLLLFN